MLFSKKKRTISSIHVLIMIVFLSCLSPSKRYINGKCLKEPIRECPFVLHIEYEKRIYDTLFINFNITNISRSDSGELLYIGYLYESLTTKDTSLSIMRYVLHTNFNEPLVYDQKNRLLINCSNCYNFFKKDDRFNILKEGQSYTIRLKYTVKGLNKKVTGDKLKLLGYVYIDRMINSYCPQIWTGSIRCISIITL